MNEYKIELRNMEADACEYKYEVHDKFFADIEALEIHKGDLCVTVRVGKVFDAFQIEIHSKGVVTLVCDRCLDEMEWPVDTNDMLTVKFGENASDDDEVVVIPEEDGGIDLAWHIYEFVALSLPLQHHHADGLCNPDMMKMLSEHTSDNEKEDGTNTDPRWNDLKKILNK